MKREQWRDLPGYEGRYQASDRGRVRNRHRRILVKCPRSNRDGRVGSWGYSLMHPVHGIKCISCGQAVARTWLPNPEGHRVVRYLNRNCRDARLENLQWVANSRKDLPIIRVDSRMVIRLDKFNKIQGVFYSVAEAARSTGILHQKIAQAIHQNSRLHEHRYFYAEEYMPALETVALAFRDDIY